jgi:predicted  nucleic acid-binding Zn-ribbon protein
VRKVELLRQLQQVDLSLDRGRERLDVVRTQLADRADLEDAAAEVEIRLREQRAIEAERVDLDLEVDDLRGKLQQLNDKLYSGRVKNPKELQDLAHEAEQLKRQISSREDRLLECYEREEAANAALAEAQARSQRAQTEWQGRQESLGGERSDLEAEVAELELERARLRESIDAAALRTYEGLRRTRGGMAVAEIRQRSCQGCRVTLPMNEEHRARTSQDLVLCPNCGRILFAGI